MPNHIINHITVTGGTPERRAQLLRLVINEEGLFDFNRIKRMPAVLCVVENTTLTSLGRAIASGDDFAIKEVLANSKNYVDMYGIDEVMKLGAIYADNLKRHGATTWYDWSWSNWGTKWNAYECSEVTDFRYKRKKLGFDGKPTHVRAYEKRMFKKALTRHALTHPDLEFIFQTAWSAPKPVIEHLHTMFPDLVIKVVYADEDLGANCGTYTLNGEESTSSIAPSYHLMDEEEQRKWYLFAGKVWYGEDWEGDEEDEDED